MLPDPSVINKPLLPYAVSLPPTPSLIPDNVSPVAHQLTKTHFADADEEMLNDTNVNRLL